MSLTSHFFYQISKLRMAPSTAVLQVIDYKEHHKKENTKERFFRLSLSDGETVYPGILHSHFNRYIIDNKIKKNSVLKVTKYSAKPMFDKVAFIILGFEIMRSVETVTSPLNDISSEYFNYDQLTQPPMQYLLISDLNPYMFNWAIKVRVINKSIKYEKRTPEGSRYYFSCVLKDRGGTEVTMEFGHKETLRYFGILKYGNVYSIANGIVQSSDHKKRSNHAPSEYRLIAASRTRVYKESDEHLIGYESYQFQTLTEIASKKLPIADFIGVTINIGPLEEVDFGERRGVPKRVVMMGDQTNNTADVSLYDNLAQMFPKKGHNIVAFKNINVSTRREISFHTGSTTHMSLDIECTNRKILKDWWLKYESIACDLPRLTVSENFLGSPIKISEIERRGYGTKEDRDDFFIIDCFITNIDSRHKCIYPACPNPMCRWKGLNQTDGVYICGRCLNYVKEPIYRFAFPLKLSDETGSIIATLLGNDILGKDILGCTANEWALLTKSDDHIKISERINRQVFLPYRMKIRARFDTFNAISKTHFLIISGQKINFAKGTREISCYIDNLSK